MPVQLNSSNGQILLFPNDDYKQFFEPDKMGTILDRQLVATLRRRDRKNPGDGLRWAVRPTENGYKYMGLATVQTDGPIAIVVTTSWEGSNRYIKADAVLPLFGQRHAVLKRYGGLFSLVMAKQSLEGFIGDLAERFTMTAFTLGPRKAQSWLHREVFHSFISFALDAFKRIVGR